MYTLLYWIMKMSAKCYQISTKTQNLRSNCIYKKCILLQSQNTGIDGMGRTCKALFIYQAECRWKPTPSGRCLPILDFSKLTKRFWFLGIFYWRSSKVNEYGWNQRDNQFWLWWTASDVLVSSLSTDFCRYVCSFVSEFSCIL